jgi:hypothetical protein
LADVTVLGSIRQRALPGHTTSVESQFLRQRLSRTWPKASNLRYMQDSLGLAQRRNRSDPTQRRSPPSLAQRRGYCDSTQRRVYQQRGYSGSTQQRRNSGDDREGWSSIVGYLLYDVAWALLRSMFIFIMYWLASHEQSMDKRIIYILLSIQMLQLDAVLKDYWYGSLKKGCQCTHRRRPERCYEGRSVVV